MLSHPLDHISETEIAYWRSRVASLEVLVCELLAKNQHMRFALEPTKNGPVNSTIAQSR
jgi:hypothetical protein